MEQNINSNAPWIIVILVLATMATVLGINLYVNQTELDRIKIDKEEIERKMQAVEDSISKLNALNSVYDNQVVLYRDSLTALTKVKNKIIIKYRDQKNFVSDASIAQLDSIIRANIGVEQ